MIPKEKVNILYLVEGAKMADGLVVVIDVFRAFSLEAYLFDMGVSSIRTVGTVEEAYQLKDDMQDSLLVGEREGKKCKGFDLGNSPSSVSKKLVAGKDIIHTTSSGTKGLVSVHKAKELLTGSLVNASAIARYILKKNPEKVSLVCMGNSSRLPAEEDILCAEYIKSLITGEEISEFKDKVLALKESAGKKFFQKEMQEIYPEQDFWMCIDYDKFDFVLVANKDEKGMLIERKFING